MSLAPGSSFGPYQILEPLGRGGMATVYRAYEPGLERHVALKVLPREFLHDETFAERFQREARVVARLEHPNIIPIHNFGIDADSRTPWMAMRLVSGGALSGLMESERLMPGRTVAILRGVAEALDYAHGKGVVHRDIKPQNILLDEAGRVYLADFGIAKMLEGSAGLTATGMISGTPQYMAPEQAMGKTLDSRADVYALGIVAYEMLAGQVPFAADTPVAVLMKHVQAEVPIPSTDEVSEPLMRALLKALAKQPEDRWDSSVEFVEALENALGLASLHAGAAATGADLPPAAGRTAGRASAVPPAAPREAPRSHAALAHATVAEARAARGGSRGGMILGLIAGVVLAGIVAIALVVLFIRSRMTETASQAPAASSPPWGDSATPPPADPTPAGALAASPALGVQPARPLPARSAAPPASLASGSERAPAVVPAASAEPPAATASAEPEAKVTTGQNFYEKTLAYAQDQSLAFDGRVGPIRVPTLLFFVSDRGAASSAKATVGRWIKRRGRRPEDDKANIRATLALECPQSLGAWKYKLAIELLDESGRALDRLSASGGCKAEAKTITAERDVPKATAEAISSARIRLEAEKD